MPRSEYAAAQPSRGRRTPPDSLLLTAMVNEKMVREWSARALVINMHHSLRVQPITFPCSRSPLASFPRAAAKQAGAAAKEAGATA